MHVMLILGILVIHVASAEIEWVPQYGTTRYPKDPQRSPCAKQNDIYLIDGTYKRSRFNRNVSEILGNSLADDQQWTILNPGTFILPKVIKQGVECTPEDIFYHEKNGAYYVSTTQGKVHPNWQNTASCGFLPLNIHENWMSLLRNEIGDMKLGDLVIPGSHDSGSYGIDTDSVVVKYDYLFNLTNLLSPAAAVNWSVTHRQDLAQQLSEGFRQFDLRIADLGQIDGTFRWWHGLSGGEITEGLDQLATFAEDHPGEILIVIFQHFNSPGDHGQSEKPIPEDRADALATILLDKLGNNLIPKGNLSDNPIMNDLLATGKNILAQMQMEYIQEKDDRFWPITFHSAWVGEGNTEDLFLDRSDKLMDFKTNYHDRMTDISGCVTPTEKTISASLILQHGPNNETINFAVREISGGAIVQPHNMSFEGLFTTLVTMTEQGVNTFGMTARPAESYTNGGSVQYQGVNSMLHHWLARPNLYKVNIIYVDDLPSSTIVDTAISFNQGLIVPEVTLCNQGNPKDGYLVWDDFGTFGGSDGLECEPALVRYSISSDENINSWVVLHSKECVSVLQGQYPQDAVLYVEVSSSSSTQWYVLYAHNVDNTIATNVDVYVRTSDLGGGSGFGYADRHYNIFGDSCTSLPTDTGSLLGLVQWEPDPTSSTWKLSVTTTPNVFMYLAVLYRVSTYI